MAFAQAEFFGAADCLLVPNPRVATEPAIADSSGEWLSLAAKIEAPPLAVSVLVSFVVESGNATDFDVFFDVLFFGETFVIFADGFESGDVSAWSPSP